MLLLSDIKIEIKGKSLKHFENVMINENMYGIDSFEISCPYGSIEKSDGFLIENSKAYLGAPITIQTKISVGSGEKDALSFKGIVTEITGIRSEMADNDKITISGGSMEMLLKGKPTCRAFMDKTLEEIVKEVLKPYPSDKFGKKVAPRDSFSYPYIVQYNESDLEFLKRLSIRYGEWFFFDGKDMIFGELPKNKVDVTIGKDLHELRYQLRVNPVSFTLQSVDPLKRDLHKHKSGGGKAESNLNSYGKFALDESKKIFSVAGTGYYEHVNVEDSSYQQCLEKAVERDEISDAVNLADISGSGTNPLITPGIIMAVSCPNPDPKAGGNLSYLSYRVTSVVHHFDNLFSYGNTYTAVPVETTLPENTDPYFIRIAHNQVGVVKDNDDPDNLGRVKIGFWWMNDDSMTPWVKIITPFTEDQSGIYFVPAINSRVLCGYEGGDVEKPYCFGAMFDKVHSPDSAWTGSGDAKVYAIRTVSGQTIELHDKSGSEKITIYDTGKKNEITLDSAKGEITIKATEKLTIEAKEIEIKAQMGMKIEAGQTLEQKGMEIKSEAQTSMESKATSIEIKANASLKAQGSATAEVSSSGIMTVKGSMVMIN